MFDPKRLLANSRRGVSRRSLLEAGVLSVTGLGLPDWLRARAAQTASRSPRPVDDLSVILVWLDGGPPQHETYDPKPHAPAEFRGPLRAMGTSVPGIQISELLPAHARVMHKMSLIRSMCHTIDINFGDHFTAEHVTLTGYNGGVRDGRTAPRNPSFGSVIGKLKGARRRGVPPYVGLPEVHTSNVIPGYHSAAYLGTPFDPFVANGDPNSPKYQVPSLTLSDGVSLARLEHRRSLQAAFDQFRRAGEGPSPADRIDPLWQSAYTLLTSSTVRSAFELARESPQLRDRYGRHEWGQSALVARRLIEAGVRFVTLTFSQGPIQWDLHTSLESRIRPILPPFDLAVATLVADLDERGLLDSTMVIVMGEFGRTPRMNAGGGGDPNPGRDHWGQLMSVLVAGGGFPRGHLIGSSSPKGEEPKDRPVAPQDLMVTVYHRLGIDPATSFEDPLGRPITIGSNGTLIQELC
jgi:Protein of unknown function (DUF1501)